MANPILKFVESVCVQKALYWGNPTPDGFGGKTYDDVIEIKCRWDDKQELILNKEGKEVMSNAEITVIDELSMDGLIKLGTYEDITEEDPTEVIPLSLNGIFTIVKTETTPLFRSANEFVRRVWV